MGSRRPFAVECFDPKDLSLLRAALDEAWSRVRPTVPSGSEDAVRNTMSVAIFEMARTGQRDLERLRSYAVTQGLSAVERLCGGRVLHAALAKLKKAADADGVVGAAAIGSPPKRTDA